ncbi:MAG: proton-conducting transporter membrane subunit [Chloroflexi bacterium]|nr:proton-conducting transporter membrane subunit [Chloroflexota bacterium]
MQGAILQGLNHGLSTGALFFLVGVIYEQSHTRQMSELGGLWKVIPVFTALSLVVVLSSMGLPGLNGFVGEFSILLGSMGAESLGPSPWIYTAFASTGVILAAVYLLWFFQNIFMGAVNNPKNEKLRDVNRRELVIFIAFLIFIVWIGVMPTPYFNLIDSTVSTLVNDIGATVLAGQ